ncbi:MAG: glutamyl-tRNA reductase [Rhodoluna sp.]
MPADSAYNIQVALVLLGSNYNDIPLSELESLERHTEEIRKTLFGSAATANLGSGGVLIGTCNRFEVYLDTDRFHDAVEQTIRVVSDITGLGVDYCSKILRVTYGSAVAQHLYSVASGLDSMIVGEGEIAGQVRRSLQDAQTNKHTTTNLERLFQSAANVAKKVSADTGLGVAGRSIIASALDIFEAQHFPLAGKKALVIGTGAYARVIVAALQRVGCTDILVYSASGRAEEFSEGHETTAVPIDGLSEALSGSEIVIAASGGQGYSIDFKLAKAAFAERDFVPIIDVSLSPSVAPPVYDMRQVSVIDLDYIRLHAPVEHSEAILAAQEIVHKAVLEFDAETTARSVDPMVSALRSHVGYWVEEEVERVRRKSGDETAEAVAHSLKRVVNALLHTPSVNAKLLAKQGQEQNYMDAIRLLFDIDLNQSSADQIILSRERTTQDE